MLNKIKPDIYYEHIRKTDKILGTVQWQDQFELRINMEKPVKKEIVPPELIKSFSLHYNGFTVDSSKIGSQVINYFYDADPFKIDIVFYNPIQIGGGVLGKDESIIDYLTKVDKKSIIPKDGTFLLGSEYNFYIECYALDGNWDKKLLIKDYFIIGESITQDFLSDDGNMQEIPVTFERYSL